MAMRFPRPPASTLPNQARSATEEVDAQLRSWQSRTWRTFGTVCIAIGLVNAFIPLLPTTVFLLVGLWAYSKSDPSLRERLLAHPRFGPGLRRWLDHGQISGAAKLAACTSIALSAAVTYALVGPGALTWTVLAGLGVLIAYLASRPSGPLDPVSAG